MENKQYAKFLRNLAANGPAERDRRYGACCLFFDKFDIQLADITPVKVYESWPYYSGCKTYPVPSPNNRHDYINAAETEYDNAYRDYTMWAGEYGKLRRDWCLHLAKYFEDLDNGSE